MVSNERPVLALLGQTGRTCMQVVTIEGCVSVPIPQALLVCAIYHNEQVLPSPTFGTRNMAHIQLVRRGCE